MKFKVYDQVIDTRRNIEVLIISILSGKGESVYVVQHFTDNEIYLATDDTLIPYNEEYFKKNSYGG